MKYKVEYNGKTYHVAAETATEAIGKVETRPVFGKVLIPYRIQINLVDADTRGKMWALGRVNCSDWNGKENRRIFAEIESED